MKVWYLDHSGFLVETERWLLVFDYYTDTPAGGTLADGVADPALLAQDKPLAVFVSHGHYDHYNRVVHSWQEQRPGTLLFLGDDIPPRPGAVTVPCHEAIRREGITVTGLRSTDQGAAFLVEADGHTIYHAGDLNWWHWDGESEEWLREADAAYLGEIERLRDRRIDLAMVPVDPRLERTALWGARALMERAQVSHLLPMHMWGDYAICDRLKSDPDCAFFADRVLAVTQRGQCFTL